MKNEIVLTVESIDQALKSDFYHNTESMAIVDAATKAGYVIRLSATQAQWSEEGLKRAQMELKGDKVYTREEVLTIATQLNEFIWQYGHLSDESVKWWVREHVK